MRRNRRKGALAISIMGLLFLLPFTFSNLGSDTLDQYPSTQIIVNSYGYEKFESKRSRWFIVNETSYYEYAIYSSDSRFFIRSPDFEQLKNDSPRVREKEVLTVHIEATPENGKGYRVVNIESKRGTLYYFDSYKYDKEYRNWFMAVLGITWIIIGMVVLYFFPAKNS